MQKKFFCCPEIILLHKYQQNIFVDLTKLFSQCIFIRLCKIKFFNIQDIFLKILET